MFHPSRGGVRGGADQFEWESVKSDKHRENYLGHSLMAPVGRWQKNKDLQWFSRDKGGTSSSKEAEKEAIKRMEADAMAAALGHAPVKRAGTSQLTKQELEEVFRKGQTERDDKDIERIEGMGFGSTRASLMDSVSTKETMSAIGSQIPKQHGKQEDRSNQANMDTKESRRKRKKEKKEKKEKRKKKKKSKSSKRSQRNDSPSDSDSSDTNARDGDRHRRRHSDNDDDKKMKSKAKRTRHDSTSDSESDSRNVRTSDLKAKVSKRRHDSTSDDSDGEPHSKKKQSSDRKKTKRHFSSKEEHKHSKDDRKKPRRQRHDSYSD